MKKFSCMAAVFALVLILGVTTAKAQMYLSGNVGMVMVSDADVSDSFFGGTIGEISFDTGFGLFGALGNDFGNNFRGEFELGYRLNDLDKITGKGVFAGFGSEPLNGDISSLSFMANGFYDINVGAPIIPFIGAGVGLAVISVDSFDAAVDDSDTVFAVNRHLKMTHHRRSILTHPSRLVFVRIPGFDSPTFVSRFDNIAVMGDPVQ